uniref:BolA family member 3 n=1 Tax=Fundulus heteroclitus TaxID=8078 RepID=A0A3Q2P0D7_FUNHE
PKRRRRIPAVCQLQRGLSSQTDGEERIASVLKEKFPQASKLKVVDISGLCCAHYSIIACNIQLFFSFALKEEIQGMHGLRIFTDIPK